MTKKILGKMDKRKTELLNQILYYVNTFERPFIADVGCMDGWLFDALNEYGIEYHGVGFDIVKHSGYTAPQRHILTDLNSTKRLNQQYDIIVCSEVLEHLINPLNTLKTFERSLKNRGLILLTLPLETHLASRLKILLTGHIHNPLDPTNHKRFFQISDLYNLIGHTNLDLVEIFYHIGGNRMYKPVPKVLKQEFPETFAHVAFIVLQK